MFNKDFNSLIEVIQEFSSEEKCIAHLEELYWNGVPVSPFAEGSKVYKCAKGRYRCKDTGKYFTVKTGTMFDGTRIPLTAWFASIYLVLNHKKGISSLQLQKDLGNKWSQKTCWYLLHRIRTCLGIENDADNTLGGICEIDETFVGGKNKNRHKDKKVEQSQGRSFKDKTPIVGVLQRGYSEIVEKPHPKIEGKTIKEKIVKSYSKVRLTVVPDTKSTTIQPIVERVIEKDSVVITDEWQGYKNVHKNYDHHVVDHGKKQYVDYDNPEIHSNGIESFWGILKRGYNGTYNWWSKKHMQKYADEFAFRFNTRGISTNERFNYFLANSNVRTKYKDLVN